MGTRQFYGIRIARMAGLYALLSTVSLLFVGPFLILLSTSLKPSSQSVTSFPPDLIPRPPVLDYFIQAWTTIPFPQYLMNSVLYIVLIVPAYLMVSALTAYPLSRYDFKGRGFFFLIFISTMFLPGELMLIPMFITTSQLGLTDTYAGVILPSLLGALGIFLLRQAFTQIPRELFEAARIDGAGEWRIFSRIAIPLVMPTLAVLAILAFISVWNSFLWPMIVLTDQSKYPIALGLAYLTGISGNNVRSLAAGTVISLVPIVIMFIAMQRQILGSLGGALKG